MLNIKVFISGHSKESLMVSKSTKKVLKSLGAIILHEKINRHAANNYIIITNKRRHGVTKTLFIMPLSLPDCNL